MKKRKQKILYDKESGALSIEMRAVKSVDSDIHDNVVIDYDGKGRVVRVNIYGINFSAFKEMLRGHKMPLSVFTLPAAVK